MISRISDYNINEDILQTLKNKLSETIPFDSSKVTRIAWGEYHYNTAGYPGRVTNIDSKYSFDDGAVWQVVMGDDGKEYLVKEVVDDEIVRIASLDIINHTNVNRYAKALGLFNLDDKSFKFFKDNKLIPYKMVNAKLIDYVKNYITSNKKVESKKQLNKVLSNLNKYNVQSLNDINKVIDLEYSKREVLKK